MPDGSTTERLEAATNKVGKAFGELLNVFEKHGDKIEEKDLDKVFAFLSLSLHGVHQKALIARGVAVATNGGFTLDMELPAPNPGQVMRVAGQKRTPTPPPSLEPENDDDVGFIDD